MSPAQQAQIGAIVHELAEDLDGAARLGGRFAFSGDDLRAFYSRVARLQAPEAVLDDLRHRRAEQVACRLCPLTWPAARRGNPA